MILLSGSSARLIDASLVFGTVMNSFMISIRKIPLNPDSFWHSCYSVDVEFKLKFV